QGAGAGPGPATPALTRATIEPTRNRQGSSGTRPGVFEPVSAYSGSPVGGGAGLCLSRIAVGRRRVRDDPPVRAAVLLPHVEVRAAILDHLVVGAAEHHRDPAEL